VSRTQTPETLAAAVKEGKPAAVARAISWCEAGGDRAEALLGLLPARQAHVVGITGSPGAGKSTLLNALLKGYREDERLVGVVAVDPSSPLTGGALLGDRVRLEGMTGDRGVFFRSLATRGAAGGLSAATRAAATVLSAAGFDPVLIETVGAGQAEVEIMRVADTVAVVLTPGAGDEVQALKAGLMEIADVYVLNKADRPGIGEVRANVAALLHTREQAAWRPPMVETVAVQGAGIAELRGAFTRHREFLSEGVGTQRLSAGARAEALRVARAAFDRALTQEQPRVLEDLAAGRLGEIQAGRALARRAARALMEADDE
jgi:LAO/AO transport system kinase